MTSFRSSLPMPGSRLPTRMASPAPEHQVHPVSPEPNNPQKTPQQRGIPRIKGSKSRNPRKRPGRPLPLLPAPANSPRALRAQSSSPAGVASEVMTSSQVDSNPNEHADCSKTNVSSKSSTEYSQYSGPQLVEPCVGNALFHVLQPCGHRVMTRNVQLCGQNCKGGDSPFANKKTQARFACAVCISKYVHEHYTAKKDLFIPSLDMLEAKLGGFRAGWKAKRVARMERVWKNDALEEQRALERLGRRCEAVSSDPDEEKLVEDEEGATLEVQPSAECTDLSARTVATLSCVETKTGRLGIPVAKRPKSRSQLPAPSSQTMVDTKHVERQRENKKTTRIPLPKTLS